ncbi:MAG: sulfotransferase [Bacteroidales bacterium]
MKKIFLPILIKAGKRIEKRKFNEPPIYIGGCGRSGTTLLLSILSAHNDIFACPRELNLFDRAEITGSDVITPKFYRLYRTFITNRIKSTATRYCEKSPSNICKIPLIEKLHHKNFKLIHIIRDGRDVILSKHPRGKDKYWVEPERWVDDVSEGLKFQDHPSVHTIRYEDLVKDYPNTIGEICSFLEMPLSDEIINWHKNATVRQNNALYQKIDEISTTSVEKWKKPENSERVQQLTGNTEGMKLLEKLGYI